MLQGVGHPAAGMHLWPAAPVALPASSPHPACDQFEFIRAHPPPPPPCTAADAAARAPAPASELPYGGACRCGAAAGLPRAGPSAPWRPAGPSLQLRRAQEGDSGAGGCCVRAAPGTLTPGLCSTEPRHLPLSFAPSILCYMSTLFGGCMCIPPSLRRCVEAVRCVGARGARASAV